MTLPDVLKDWKVVLMLVVGIVSVCNGIRIWINKVTKVADPLLWGPLTGGLGCLIVGFVFHDEEIRGFPARMVAVFQMAFGLLCLVLFFFIGVWPAYFAKRAEPVDAAKPAREMAYIPAPEAPKPAKALPAPAPEPATAPVATTTSPTAGTAQAATVPPREPEKPGTIVRMSKGWMPEGMQRR